MDGQGQNPYNNPTSTTESYQARPASGAPSQGGGYGQGGGYPAPIDQSRWIDPFVMMILVGVFLLALSNLILVFSGLGDLPGELVAPVLFNALGSIALAVGFGLAAALGRNIKPGARVALLVAGGYFASSGGLLGGFLGALGSLGSLI